MRRGHQSRCGGYASVWTNPSTPLPMRVALRRLRTRSGQVGVMIVRPELNAADWRARDLLRLDLRKQRKEQQVGPSTVAQHLGIGRSSFQKMEIVTTWTAPVVQAWARILVHRLTLTIEDLTVPDDDGDMTAAVLAAVTTFGDLDEDRHHLLTVANNLIRVRRAAGISVSELANRMQVTDRAVWGWENDHTNTQVRTVQRYGRALGGSVVPALEPVVVAVTA